MNFKCINYLVSIVLLPAVIESCRISEPATKPKNAAWEKIGPGGGGYTHLSVFSPYNPDKFLVQCDMTGSYLTNNGGASYDQLNFANGASAYAYDPLDSNVIYIGSAVLNRSADGGKTWEQLFPSPADIGREEYMGDEAEYRIEAYDPSRYPKKFGPVGSIRVDPLMPGAVYFSMDSLFFYSTDNGKTWAHQNLQATINYIYTNTNSVKDEVLIFTSASVVTFNKISHSISARQIPVSMQPAFSYAGGTKKNSDSVIFYSLHTDENSEEEYASTDLWISRDKGNSWTQVSDPVVTNPGGKKPGYSIVNCAEADAGQAYLVTTLYPGQKENKDIKYWYGSLKTNDGGYSWGWVWKGGGGSGKYGVKDGIDAGNLDDAWAGKAFGGEFIQLSSASVYPFDGNIAILSDWYRTMKTMDGGKTWKQVYSKQQPDGSFSTNGMDVTTTYGVHFDPFDSNHLAISYTDIGFHHSYNRGKSWIRSVNGVPNEWVNTCYWVVFDPAVKGKVWSAWSGIHDIPRTKMFRHPDWKKNCRGGICVSSDGGKTWKVSNEGIGDNAAPTSIVLDTHSAPNRRILYASVFNKGVFKSEDDGRTWKLKNKGLDANSCPFELTLTANGNLFLVVTPTPVYEDGKIKREITPGAVYKSVDKGETWMKLSIKDGYFFPNGMETDPQNPDKLYLACWSTIELSDIIGRKTALATGGNENIDMDGGIYMSDNGGSSWRQIFDKKIYVYDVTADPYHPGRLYCNTFNKAAYRSDDYGKTWRKIKGYDFHWGHRVIPDENDHEKVYITTFGSSVWHGVPDTE